MMGNVQYTKEQQRAMQTEAKEILISAAAGAGKTAVLIERIFQMIKNKNVSLKEIVVLTFTKAAAIQMKQRLRKKLQDAIHQAQDETDKKLFTEQLLALPFSQVSTFHAFCIQILRQEYHVLGISPTFKIGDDNEVFLLQQEAFEQALEYFIINYPNQMQYIGDAYIRETSIHEFKELIFGIFFQIQSFASFEEWEKQIYYFYQTDEGHETLFQLYVLQMKEKISQIQKEFNDCYHLFLGFDKNQEHINTCLQQLDNILKNITTDFSWAMQQIQHFEFGRLPSIKKDEATEDTENAKTLYTKIKKEMKKNFSLFYTKEVLSEQQMMLIPLVDAILLFLNIFQEQYTTLKGEKDILDFSDLEQYTLTLLKNYPDIRKKIGEQIHEVLVDEYQDTNDVQESILRYLKTENNHLFMVGDVKQSIYRFRFAEPRNFIEKSHKFSLLDDKKELILLNKNFRTRDTLLRGINAIFTQLFREEFEYTADQHLIYGNLSLAKTEDIEMFWHFFSHSTLETKDKTFVSEKKVHYILTEIIYQLNFGVIHEGKITRNVRLNDIAIIFRNKNTRLLKILEKELETLYIPYTNFSDKGYFDAIEVNNVLSLLSILHNPYDDIAFLGVLRSPLIFISDEHLLHIKEHYLKKHETQAPYFTMAQFYVQTENDHLKIKLENMLNLLQNFRDFSNIHNIAQTIQFIFSQTYYDAYVSRLPNGKVRKANLDVLYKLALHAEQLGFKTLRAFNHYMKGLQKHQRDFPIAQPKEGKEILQMMTIHKSKGLEFPIVFLIDLDHQFNMQDARSVYQVDKNYGLGLRYTDNEKKIRYRTWFYDYLQNKKRAADLAEEVRVLYVALTRGVHQLHIFLDTPEENKKIDHLNMAKSLGDFLRYAYNYGDYTDMIQQKMIDITTIKPLEITSFLSFTNRNTSGKEIEQKTIDFYIESMKRQYTYKYLNVVSQKMTVTELKNLNNQNFDENYQKKVKALQNNEQKIKLPTPSFIQAEKLSPTERGNLYHYLLQHYPFEKDIDLNLYIREHLNKEYINLIQYEAIDPNILKHVIYYVKNYLDQGYCIIGREIAFSMQYLAKNVYPNIIFNQDEKILIQGKIDLVLQREDTFLILDYKTDIIENKNKQAILKQRYQQQMELYCEAIKKLYLTDKVIYELISVS